MFGWCGSGAGLAVTWCCHPVLENVRKHEWSSDGSWRTAGRPSASRRHVDHSASMMLRGPVSPGQRAPPPSRPDGTTMPPAPGPPAASDGGAGTMGRWTWATRAPSSGSARRRSRAARSAPPSRSGRTGAGGTPTPTTISPSTAPTSATSTSSGAPRACAKPTPACSATSPDAASWRSAAARRRAHAGSRPRAPGRWVSISRAGCCDTPPRSTPRRVSLFRSCRPGPSGCPSPTGPSTWPARRSARCPSWRNRSG